MLDHMDGVMQTIAKKKTSLKEDLYFVMKCVQQKLSKHRTRVTPITWLVLISAYILDLFHMLQLFS